MLTNYLKIAFRSLLKNRAYSFLNIFGLTIGITCSFLIYLYVQDELTFDSQHTKADRIFRVACEYSLPNDGGTEKWAVMSDWVPQYFVKDYPEVLKAVRFRKSQNVVVERPEGVERFYEEVVYADSAVFSIFDFPLLKGDSRTALNEPFTVVISEHIAQKYFGSTDPIGKVLSLPDFNTQLTVKGILAPIPHNSHLKFHVLASFETLRATNRTSENNWWNFSTYVYLETQKGTDPEDLENKIKRISAKYILDQEESSGYRQEYYLMPLKDIHLKSSFRAEFAPGGNMNNVRIFALIGLFILLIACINFMNLATARSVKRAKEVGVRKVVGAYKKHLIVQFLNESVVLSFMAMVLSVALILLALPLLNDFTNKQLVFNPLSDPGPAVILLGITMLVGLLAGSYPALVLSSFKPVETLKGSFQNSSKGAMLRKFLVVFQFVISIALIISTYVVFNQLQYMRQLELGFQKERMIYLPTRFGQGTAEKFAVLRDELKQTAAVKGTALSSNVPGVELGNNVVRLGWDNNAEWSDMRFLAVDYDFIDLYGLKMAAGRGFDRSFPSDETEGFILNESGVKRLGFDSPQAALGKPLRWQNRQGRVIGVVRDFYFMSVQQEVEPFIMVMLADRTPGYLSVNVATDGFGRVVNEIEARFNEIMPDRIFEYYFLDQDFDEQYKAEANFSRIFTVFSFVAIWIACMGLYGLASYSAEQKMKEIGVRKVLGATVAGIVALLSGAFLKLVVIAFVLASPLAYFAMDNWLAGFAERISIGAIAFIISLVFALLITLLTISYQSIRAARANPIKSLRYE